MACKSHLRDEECGVARAHRPISAHNIARVYRLYCRPCVDACRKLDKDNRQPCAHESDKVTRRDAFFKVLNLYNLVGGVLLKLRVLSSLAPFDGSLLPTGQTGPTRPTSPTGPKSPTNPTSTEAFVAKVEPEKVEAAPAVKADLSWGDISEAETRRRFIDLMLREADGRCSKPRATSLRQRLA